jgi:FMN phosphatase YigB (HAD superfamily)
MSKCCDAGRCVYHTLVDENEALKKQNKEIKEELEVSKFHEKQLREQALDRFKQINKLNKDNEEFENYHQYLQEIISDGPGTDLGLYPDTEQIVEAVSKLKEFHDDSKTK